MPASPGGPQERERVLGDLQRENERLVQANRDLEERLTKLRRANAELARACQFTSECCHELRAPLASIIAYAELLQEETGGPLTDLQREYVDGIVEQGQELLTSMNDILDLARMEAGRMEVRTAPLRLSEVVGPLVKRMEPRARRKGLSLRMDMGQAAEVPVEADRQKVERVLCNILDNALKFTPPGGEVSVRVGWEAAAGVVVAVRDTGPGIPREEQEAIFDRYYRARDRGDSAGAGLGLTLARQLVEMQGGRIWVESEPGRGATFYVAFPPAGEDLCPAGSPRAAGGSRPGDTPRAVGGSRPVDTPRAVGGPRPGDTARAEDGSHTAEGPRAARASRRAGG